METREKLQALRDLMQKKGIDVWIQPSGDPHQSEYMADHWKSRAWLSGFTGSAGECVVTADKAGLWTDSRYYIQAEKQLSGSSIELFKSGSPGVPNYRSWLAEELAEGSTVGFDGSLLSVAMVRFIERELKHKNIKLSYNRDLIEEIWQDRPPVPEGKVKLLTEKYSGESTVSKIIRVREELVKKHLDYLVVSALDEIAWLFNIRGSDIKYNPVVISYAFLSKDDVCLFINSSKLNKEVRMELESNGIKIFPYDNIFEFLSLMPEDKLLYLTPTGVSIKLQEAISCRIQEGKSIISRLKGVKNAVEQEGIRKAHIQDGIAMVRFLYYLEQNIGKTAMDEFSIGETLHEFRAQGELFRGDSFNPIVGYKENGAIVHYSARKETAASVKAEGLLLIDSGGQYLNGTTDITRTVSLGKVTDEEKRYFTTVLKGHIDLARSKFPKNSGGVMVDTYARTPLWQQGLNYFHGTGHGVGHYLCVHEGPQSISHRGYEPLLPGSVTTNEPGIYLEGKFGIRIENIMICRLEEKSSFGEFCGFETVTLCPIDRKLIKAEMLGSPQLEWLNSYHQGVYEKLSPYLGEQERDWLRRQTRELRG